MKTNILILIILVIFAFCGCNPKIVPTQNIEGDIIFENGEYFLRVNNGARLGFHDASATKFDSVDEIKRRIKTNDLTNQQISIMYNIFYTVEGDSDLLPIIDPDKMLIPIFNGRDDYNRLGFINRTFWCDIKQTHENTEYELIFYIDYEPTKKTESPKETYEQRIQDGKYTDYSEYNQDGIAKKKLVVTNDTYYNIFYETETKNISYYVVETYADGNLRCVEYWGDIKNIGRFYLLVVEENYSAISKEAVQWIMESIELKKA